MSPACGCAASSSQSPLSAKVWLEPEVKVARPGRTLKKHELNRALDVIARNRDFLLEQWHGYTGRT